MTTSNVIDRNPDHLHPQIRARVRDFLITIGRDTDLAFFEGYRSPERQMLLLGTTGNTKAPAFESAHQFGLAFDLAANDGKAWSWDIDPGIIQRAHAQAAKLGLYAPIDWDPLHFQVRDWRTCIRL